MPDMEELEQIQMLANLLTSMPPQQQGGQRIALPRAKTTQWATELVRDFGVRVHVDLAKKELMPGAPSQLGNLEPRRVDQVVRLPDLLNLLRAHPDVPGLTRLADDIDDALGDPDKEAALRARISREHPDVVATARKLAEKAPPEVYEK